MTEQEAEVLAERLRRVWEFDEAGVVWRKQNPNVVYFEAKLRAGAFFLCLIEPPWSLVNITAFDSSAVIAYRERDRVETVTLDLPVEPVFEHATPQWKPTLWVPIFRRGCWLSGFDIDASAHEKAEWMQGFSREEIEGWDLKL